MNLYPWFLWLHVLSAFIFFFAHGTAMGIAFRLPVEKNPERMKALLDITGITAVPLGVGMLGTGVFSVAMAVMSGWWKFG